MTIVELLASLAEKDIRLWLDEGRLRYSAPEGAFTADVRDQVVANKNAIIDFLQQAERTSQAPIPVADRQLPLPLSYAQQRLWFIDQLEPGNLSYNIPAAMRLTGQINHDALRRAIETIIERHEGLRTHFVSEAGEPRQVIAEPTPWNLPIEDHPIAGMDGEQIDELLGYQVQSFVAQPFDLAKGPLVRALLVRLAERDHLLMVNMHHIVSDGWSLGVLVQEMVGLYQAYNRRQPSPLPDLAIQYGDYAAWQRQWLTGDLLDKQVNYWKHKLASVPVLQIPTDHPRPQQPSLNGEMQRFVIDTELTQGLNQLARQHDATLFMVLLAAYGILLNRYSGQDDFCIGTPIANRPRSELEPLIGFFVNTLALRVELEDVITFADLIDQAKATTLEAYGHQDLPFERIVDEVGVERSLSQTPLFQAMLVLQNTPMTQEAHVPGMDIEVLNLDRDSVKYDIALSVNEHEDKLYVELSYKKALFDHRTMATMSEYLQRLLASLVSNPEWPLLQHQLLDQGQLLQLAVWNQTERHYPVVAEGQTLSSLFSEQVTRTPERAAVVFSGQQLTFAELDQCANQLARLLQNKGVEAHQRVGIYLPRGTDQIVAILACWKLAAAYVPLDPSYPLKRLQYMVEDSGATAVICDAGVTESWLVNPVSAADALNQSTDALDIDVSADDSAYIIYTSGTTGKAKGVDVAHRSVVNLHESLAEVLGLDQQTEAYGVTVNASITFDSSVKQLIQILRGATLYPVAEDLRLEPQALFEFISDPAIQLFDVTPSQLNALLQGLSDHQLQQLPQRLIIGGEAINRDLWQRLLELRQQGVQAFNVYGPTECTVDTTCAPVVAEQPNIGRPLANIRLLVLDGNRQPVPIGLPGELYVAGDCLAKGYLNRPELTAAAFVEIDGERCYRTGDRVRLRRDGLVDYLGRVDDQIKIRGFRVELGEVESALARQTSVSSAAVLVHKANSGADVLVGYVVAAEGQTIDESALRNQLLAELPDYMVPVRMITIEQMPLTPNGKVDKRALPKPEGDLGGTEFVAAETDNEKILVAIWQKVLGVERVGIHDNFFALGGHSLLATQVMSRVREQLGVEVPLRALFETPTVATIAQAVEDAASSQAPPLTPVDRSQPLPLSFAQQRLWLVDQLNPGSSAYNMPAALELKGDLDVAALQRTLSEIVRRHDVFRTRFVSDVGEPVQVIEAATDWPLPVDDWRADGPAQERLQQAIEAEALAPFDLSSGPFLRTHLIQLADQHYVLLATMHHIISDGWSRGVLLQEVLALYNAYHQGKPSPLPELAVQYADFAKWQRDWLQGEVLEQHLGYWRQQLAATPILELPTDKPRPQQSNYRGGHIEFEVGPQQTARLNQIAQAHGATLFMALLAAFNVFLQRYSGQDDICVGTPIANRNRGEIEPLIGFFVNTLALRLDLSGEPDFGQLIEQSKNTTLDAYKHQDLPFERIVDEVGVSRSLTHTPLFQVMLVLQNTPRHSEIDLPGLSMESIDRELDSVKFDITLTVNEIDGRLLCDWGYRKELFHDRSAEQMVAHFTRLLSALIDKPQRPACRHALLDDEQKQQLQQWNQTERDFATPTATLSSLFTEQVQHSPERSALVFGEQQHSYAELDQRAARWAQALRERGVERGQRVGIYLPRSIEQIVAIVACWKLGAAYVPLDPAYPHKRLQYMVDDSQAAQVICASDADGDWLPQALTTAALDATETGLDDSVTVQADDVAYVIYTSGTTGKAKGVEVAHRSVVNLHHALADRLDLGLLDEGFGVTVNASITFDSSVKQLIQLLRGATLYPIPEAVRPDPQQLLAFVNEPSIQLLDVTPSQLLALLQQCAPEQLAALPQRLLIGGEAIQADLWQRLVSLAEQQGLQSYNVYGPTECTVDTTVALIEGDKPTIGAPLANIRLQLLDAQQQPVPIGLPGELYVSGDCLALGYLDRPQMTAAAFVDIDGARCYRTGDRVRYRADGQLEYLGRVDDQIKIRGFRVELGEIESQLALLSNVVSAAVVVHQAATGADVLLGYVVAEADVELDSKTLREQLLQELPDYMVPVQLIQLDEMPLTANGKVDKRALPIPQGNLAGADYVAPRNDTEQLMVDIWQEVLGIDKVGVEDNFFALGGHSLLATQVLSRMYSQFQVEVELRALFEEPTIAAIAALIEQAQAEQALLMDDDSDADADEEEEFIL